MAPMANPHAPSIDEVDDLRRLPEPQLVQRQHTVLRGEGGDVALPAEFGTCTELTTMKHYHRIACAGFQIAGYQTVDQHGFAMNLHRPPSLLDRDRTRCLVSRCARSLIR
jgi:hypothetical protein